MAICSYHSAPLPYLACMENQLISIIMPVRNAARFLPLTLPSILAQTFKNWELIAVNDHSTDLSEEILNQFAVVDLRVKVLNNPGNGIISALQHAYNHAKGSLITRMDADDLMPPVKLELLKKALTHNPDKYVSTGLVKAFGDPEPCGKGFARYADRLNKFLLSAEPWLYVYADCLIPSPCWMMHRSAFERIGAFNGEQYPEDYELCFRMYAAGCSIATVPAILHLWRDHGMRVSRTGANYAEPEFFDLKVSRFLQLDYDKSKPLVIFGTGPKGKKMVKSLQNQAPHIAFHWISNTASKWGHAIYGIKIQPVEVLNELPEAVVLMVSSARSANAPVFMDRWLKHRCLLFC